MTPLSAPRRRLYLLRHGLVDYFSAEDQPVPPDAMTLNARGERQSAAAGALFKQCGVRFDRVMVNLAPMQWLHERERLTTMEKLLAPYRDG